MSPASLPSSVVTLLLSSMVASAAAPAAPPVDTLSLPAVLQRLGEEELDRTDRGACRYQEFLTMEELGADGEPKARERFQTHVEQRGSQLKRTVLKHDTELASVSSFLKTGDNNSQPPSPFHPTVQSRYQFRMVTGQATDLVRIDIAPRRRATDVYVGHAEVDSKTGRLVSLELVPSAYPLFLSQLRSRTRYSSGDCGNAVEQQSFEGEGGMLFLRLRFRVQLSRNNTTRIGGSEGASLDRVPRP